MERLRSEEGKKRTREICLIYVVYGGEERGMAVGVGDRAGLRLCENKGESLRSSIVTIDDVT